MDAVRRSSAVAAAAAPAGDDGDPAPLPPEAPLAMPVQRLDRHERPHRQPRSGPRTALLRRTGLLAATAALTALGAHEMYLVLDVGGLTALELVVLVLFVILSAWIAFSAASALGGTVSLLRRRGRPLGLDRDAPLPAPTIRTALLMPTYNEPPARVMAGLQATLESLAATGRADRFDTFVLSDTTDADVWIDEEAAFLALRRRLGGTVRVYYRRRPRNTDRKAGNVADWVTRFGGAYEAMLIFDADSVMSGETIVRLAGAVEANPDVGLIQTLPVIVGGRSLFGRLQQFSGRLYGPLIAHGLAWWHGSESNYWGHNAIIRTRAFADHAGLPHLKGRKPFGGHILSHDFVEAALIRRAGWGVHMAPWLDGSYEEAPPSLVDLAVRDRRWCQGNLQHAAVLPGRGLNWVSRLHLLTGIGSYVTAPLWLLMLVAGLLTSLQARFVPPDYFPSAFSLFPTWPAQDPVRAAWVFVGTMGVLLAPKLVAWLMMLFDGGARRGFGGVRALFGLVFETLLSGLLAPVAMILQSRAVISILAGRDGGWQPQRRDDGSVPLAAVVAGFLPLTLLGIVLGVLSYLVAVPLFLWMSPVILGLLLAMPLVGLTARTDIGAAVGRLGLLRTPEEAAPPPVLARARQLIADLAGRDDDPPEAVSRLAGDAALRDAHRRMLPDGGARARGDAAPERLVARAKAEDAASLAEALAAMTGREKAAALGDAEALDRLLALAAGGAPPARASR